MPKSFSEQEREYIRQRLKEEAAKCLAQYGVRRTTVDEIVKRVNIPKGTFYLFYKSKELLLFEVIQEQQKNINLELYQAFSDIVDMELSAEKLTDMIFEFYKKTEKMLVLKLSDAGEIELLKRKLPQEIVDEHLQNDTDMIEKMIAIFNVKKEVDIKVISAAPGSDIKEALVLSARILTEDDINLQDYKIIMLDDNEILYIKGEKLQEIFESAGLKIEETELYVEEMRN